MDRRWARRFAGLAVTVGLVALGTTPAGAHAQLVAATPGPGSTVAAVPAEVRLTFDGAPYDYGLAVVVLSPSGSHIETGRVSVDGNDVVQRLGGANQPGTYDVRWRVVSADGHPASGEYTFDVVVSSHPVGSGAVADPSSGNGKGWVLLAVALLAVIGLVALLLVSGRRPSDLARPEGPSA